jgi:hypothetical protein
VSKKSKMKKGKRKSSPSRVTTRNQKRGGSGFVLDLGPGTIKVGDVSLGEVGSFRISGIV